MDDFILRALIAGLIVATVAGPLGCFVVWRRMAYFGDTLAHAALLGIALGLVLQWHLIWGVVAVCMALALLLFAMQQQQRLAGDTLLGIFSHAALSLGLIAVSLMELRVNVMGYLFGDLLAVTLTDIYRIGMGSAAVLVVLLALWRPLLAVTVHADLAAAEGIPVHLVRLIFMLLMALVVALAMKVVGILLTTSLLIIPAAAARRITRAPEAMALGAALLGWLAVGGGVAASWHWDTPTGPSVVVAATAIFGLSLLLGFFASAWSGRRIKPI